MDDSWLNPNILIIKVIHQTKTYIINVIIRRVNYDIYQTLVSSSLWLFWYESQIYVSLLVRMVTWLLPSKNSFVLCGSSVPYVLNLDIKYTTNFCLLSRLDMNSCHFLPYWTFVLSDIVISSPLHVTLVLLVLSNIFGVTVLSNSSNRRCTSLAICTYNDMLLTAICMYIITGNY